MKTPYNMLLKINENCFGKWFGIVIYSPHGSSTSVEVSYSSAFATASEALAWAESARDDYRREFPACELEIATDEGRAYRLMVDMAYRYAETGKY